MHSSTTTILQSRHPRFFKRENDNANTLLYRALLNFHFASRSTKASLRTEKGEEKKKILESLYTTTARPSDADRHPRDAHSLTAPGYKVMFICSFSTMSTNFKTRMACMWGIRQCSIAFLVTERIHSNLNQTPLKYTIRAFLRFFIFSRSRAGCSARTGMKRKGVIMQYPTYWIIFASELPASPG